MREVRVWNLREASTNALPFLVSQPIVPCYYLVHFWFKTVMVRKQEVLGELVEHTSGTSKSFWKLRDHRTEVPHSMFVAMGSL